MDLYRKNKRNNGKTTFIIVHKKGLFIILHRSRFASKKYPELTRINVNRMSVIFNIYKIINFFLTLSKSYDLNSDSKQYQTPFIKRLFTNINLFIQS